MRSIWWKTSNRFPWISYVQWFQRHLGRKHSQSRKLRTRTGTILEKKQKSQASSAADVLLPTPEEEVKWKLNMSKDESKLWMIQETSRLLEQAAKKLFYLRMGNSSCKWEDLLDWQKTSWKMEALQNYIESLEDPEQGSS